MPTLTGPSSTTQDITMASAGADTLTYTTVASGSMLPETMQLFVDGVEAAGVTLPAKYIGQSFTFTKAGGSPLSGVFASGVVNLVSSGTTATPTTAAPATTAGSVYYISGNKATNDGGTIKAGGNIADARVESADKVYGGERQVVGSVVVDGVNTDKGVSSGVFAYNNQSPVGKKVTVTLGGVSNTVLRSGAAQPQLVQSINKLNVLRTRRFTTAIRENKYNKYTGRFEAGYPVVAVDTLATDNAANPTRTLPGQLVYKIGANVPVTSDYKAKTN
jgi:hypothetical protein